MYREIDIGKINLNFIKLHYHNIDSPIENKKTICCRCPCFINLCDNEAQEICYTF